MEDKSKLGLISIILLGLNTVLGSGIFLLPGQVTAQIGSWSLFSYIFVTMIVLSVAWCFAKCAALFNRDGGAYLYAKHAFGDFIGFEIGVMRWAIGVISWAALVVGLVTALSSIWPNALQEPFRSIIIISLLIMLGILNMLNIGILKRLSNVFTVAKLLPLIFIVGIAIFYVKQSNINVLPITSFDSEPFGNASLMIFYAFGGFEALVVAAGEMRNPEKNLPIAVMTIIVLCAILYFLIQMVAMGTLGPALATSVSPISDIAHVVFGSYGKLIVTIAMLVSICGVNIAASFIAPKVGVALAEDGMLPEVIAHKNRFESPFVAVWLSVLVTCVIALSGSFVQLVAISAVSRFAQHISTSLAVLVFYKDKLTWQKCIPMISLAGIAWLMTQVPFYQLVSGLGALVFSIPLYFWFRRKPVPVPIPISDK